jgi:aspartate carbamoyltransferase catalytic subunit
MINGLLLKAIFFAKNPVVETKYENTFIASLFMEASTRTQLSFEIACEKLGVRVLNLNTTHSSLTKGESFEDTLQTLEAMGISAAIIRTSDDTLIESHRYNRKLSLINAGSGSASHPTQAMLDLLTIHDKFDRISDLKISIVGDINHSRVAASHLKLHNTLGNEVSICGPLSFTNKIPTSYKRVSLKEALQESDVIIFLRIQFERHINLELDKDEYIKKYALTKNSIQALSPNAILMHPGPVNRDVEIESSLMNHPQLKILNQVTNSIPMRMAIIDMILGGQNDRSNN